MKRATTGLPLVGVGATKYLKGIESYPAEGADLLEHMPLEEALQRQWPDDAHFVAWYPESGTPMPRVRKRALRSIRDAGEQLVAQVMVFDWDNPGHRKWDDELWASAMAKLSEAEAELPVVGDWCAFYTTRHGFRLIYMLDTPLKVDTFELVHQSLMRAFAGAGLGFDGKCKDWTRFFRLPFVVRDGVKTADEGTILEVRPDKQISASDWLSSPAERDTFEPTVEGPEFHYVHELPEWWLSQATTVLKRHPAYQHLINETPVHIAPGARDDTVFKWVAEVAQKLSRIEGTTADYVYALFSHIGRELTYEDPEHQDWCEIIWEKVERLYFEAAEDRKLEAAIFEEQKIETLTVVEQVVHGMSEWFRDGSLATVLSGSAEDAMRAIMPYLIVGTGRGYHVMTRTGYYCRKAVQSVTDLRAKIKHEGMDGLLPVRMPTEKGTRPTNMADYADYITVVHSTEARAGSRGLYIEGLGSSSPKLILSTFHIRTDLEPIFSQDVDDWLKAISGIHYDRLCAWLAHSLDFANPICALALEGPGGIGKKLLVQGLAECISTATVASQRAFGRFNNELLDTPFVLVNEGVVQPAGGGGSFADSFRTLTAGDPITVEPKFQEPITLRQPARVIITANNHDFMRELAKGRDLNPNDREALAKRLLYIEAPSESAHYLSERGGVHYTGKPGQRWIADDHGKGSNYILAQHIFWLYSNRDRYKTGKRFLVEGNTNDRWVKELAVQSATGRKVTRAVCEMIEAEKTPRGDTLRGFAVTDDTQVLTTAAAIQDYIERDMKQQAPGIDPILNTLEGLRDRERPVVEGRVRTKYSKQANLRDGELGLFFSCDLRILLAQALRAGYPTERLATLVDTLNLA